MSCILDEAVIEEIDYINSLDIIESGIADFIDIDEAVSDTVILEVMNEVEEPVLEMDDIFEDAGDLNVDDTDPLNDPANIEDDELIDMVMGGDY